MTRCANFLPMTKTRFEWVESKDAENQKKHGIFFWLNMQGKCTMRTKIKYTDEPSRPKSTKIFLRLQFTHCEVEVRTVVLTGCSKGFGRTTAF